MPKADYVGASGLAPTAEQHCPPLSLRSPSPPVNKLRCHGAIPLSLLRYSPPTPTEFRTQHSNDHEISFWVSINFHSNRMFCVAEVL